MNEITFLYETEEQLNNFEALFNRLLQHTKDILAIVKPLTLSVTYIYETTSVSMNAQYRGKDYIADVISFPIDDDYGIYDQLDFRELGDIFICFAEANRKAQKMHHTITTEMAWLFTHGLLHILGYDHEIEAEAQVMFALTDQILAQEAIAYEME
jgi:probable rRNA maturation factor